MRDSRLRASALFAAWLWLIAATACAQSTRQPGHSATPLMAQLSRFTASDVPALSAAETEVPPLKSDQPIAPGLPGNAMAQHPMLYIGEGYNKILLVNDGKIAWTYSTGSGWEYDDVWTLSNGNILFTRMQYVAEVTPEKKVVWRYDAPQGTEIHTCQPIGLSKVMFVLNGLPPKLMVVNIKSSKVEVEHTLPALSLSDPKTVHAQFRRVRYTSKGTYLVSFLEMDKVIEYNKHFHGDVPVASSNQLRVLGAYSRHLREGMVRVDASSTNPDLLVSAYEGKDKMRTVIATSRSTSPQSLTVNWPGTTWSELELVSQYDENERETGSNRTVIQPGEIVVFSTMVSPPMD